LLSGPSPRLGLAELSGELGLPKGTVFGILRTLQLLSLVEKDPESRKYQLGPGLVRLGMRYLDTSELHRHALRWSDALASRSNETVRVGILHDRQVLVLHHVFRRAGGREAFPTGAMLPLHATAMGKILLATSQDASEQLAASELTPFTAATTTDPDRLASGLEDVRERGWASSIEEFVEGVASLAAPIRDRRGTTVGALSLSAPVGRLCRAGEPRQGLVLSVRDFAGAISRDLGARPWELTLQGQLQTELGLRLRAELEQRDHAGRDLHEEVRERRAMWHGMWSTEHPRGLTTDTARWEMEQTLRRQGAELAETERQLTELRERLRLSERAPVQAGGIVDAQPAASAATEELRSAAADSATAVARLSSSLTSPAEDTAQARGQTSTTQTVVPAAVVASPGVGGVAFGSREMRLFAEKLADELLQRWQGALQEQFRGELGQCLVADVKHRDHGREPRQQVGYPAAARRDVSLISTAGGM
jgi:DNA-binding IclR family transcriptional regulator